MIKQNANPSTTKGSDQVVPSEILRQVKQVRRSSQSRDRRYAWLVAASVLAITMLFAMMIEARLNLFSHALRFALTMFSLAATAVCGWILWQRGRRENERLVSAAKAVDSTFPVLEQRVSTLTSCEEDRLKSNRLAHPAMLNRLAIETSEIHQDVETRPIVSQKKLGRPVKMLAVAALALLAMFIWDAPKTLVQFGRFWAPWSTMSVTGVESVEQDSVVARHEPLRLTASLSGRKVTEVDFYSRGLEDGEVSETRLWTSSKDPSIANFRQSKAVESFDYRFRAGDGQTEWHRVTVADRPRITDLEMRIVPPAYTGKATQTFNRLPKKLRVVAGSRLEMQVTPKDEVRTARLVMGKTDWLPMDVAANGAYDASMELRSPVSFEVQLTELHGLTNRRPPRCSLQVVADQAPKVKILKPTKTAVLLPDETIDIHFKASDDHGIQEMALRVYTQREGEDEPTVHEVPISISNEKNPRKIRGSVALDLAQFDLKDGDTIRYEIRASDNYRPLENLVEPFEFQPMEGVELVQSDAAEKPTIQAEAARDVRSKSTEQKDLAESNDLSQPSKSSDQTANAQMAQSNSTAQQNSSQQNNNPNATNDNNNQDNNASANSVAQNAAAQSNAGNNSSGNQAANQSSQQARPGSANESSAEVAQAEKPADDQSAEMKAEDNPASMENKIQSERNESEQLAEADNENTDESNAVASNRSPSSSGSQNQSNSGSNQSRQANNSKQASQSASSSGSQSGSSASSKMASNQAEDKQPDKDESETQTDDEPNMPPKSDPVQMATRSLDIDRGQSSSSGQRQIKVDQYAGGFSSDQRYKLEIAISPTLELLKTSLMTAGKEVQRVMNPTKEDETSGDSETEMLQSAASEMKVASEAVIELNQKTRNTPYAFVGLRLESIRTADVAPAWDDLRNAIDTEGEPRLNHSSSAWNHINHALATLAKLEEKYEQVKRELKKADDIQRFKKMHRVFIENSLAMLNPKNLKLNGQDRKAAEFDLDEEYLERLKEVLQMRQDMMAELARILADDPQLLRRYMNQMNSRNFTIRDQLTLIARDQEELSQQVIVWEEASKNPKELAVHVIGETEMHLSEIQELANRLGDLQDEFVSWLPLEDDVKKGEAAETLAHFKAAGNGLTELVADVGAILAMRGPQPGANRQIEPLLAKATDVDKQLAAVNRSLQRMVKDVSDPELANNAARRLPKLQVLRRDVEQWAGKLELLGEGSINEVYAVDQEKRRDQLLQYSIKIASLDSQLAAALQNQDGELPEDVAAKSKELQELLDVEIPADQLVAAQTLSDGDATPAMNEQVKITEKFDRAEDLFDEILQTIADELDKLPVEDPIASLLRDPTLDEILAQLENELDFLEELGLSNRPSNLQIIGDWMNPSMLRQLMGQQQRMRNLSNQAWRNALARARVKENAKKRKPKLAKDDRRWNLLVSQLDENMLQGDKKVPPERYRSAIDQYFEKISKLKSNQDSD
jgi:hypothetical protein